MGNSVEEWRSSVGRWYIGRYNNRQKFQPKSLLSDSDKNSCVPSLNYFMLAVLTTLLIISGIETNPGPVNDELIQTVIEMKMRDTEQKLRQKIDKDILHLEQTIRQKFEEDLKKKLEKKRQELEEQLNQNLQKKRQELEEEIRNQVNTEIKPVLPAVSECSSTSMAGIDQYEKTTGFANMTGELYEVKLAALLMARGLITGDDFYIASNMKAGGAFDDIVLKFGHRTIFLQLKHREDPKNKLQMSHLILQKKGDFSLIRYFKSYLEIKQKWTQNTDLQFCGRFEDALFVVYTNAGLEEGLGSEVDKNNWQNFLSSGGKCIIFTEEICPLKSEDSSAYRDFLSNLWFFSEQASEKQLDVLIKKSLETLCGTDVIYEQLLTGVQNWWRNSNIYLTVEIDFWRNILQSLISGLSCKNNKEAEELGIHFNKEEHTIIQTFLLFAQLLYIIPKSANDSDMLSFLKVHQSLTGNCHILINAGTLETHLSEVLAIWSRWCDVLVIKGDGVMTMDPLVDILHKCKRKKLIIVGGTIVWNVPHCKCATFLDRVFLEQFDFISQARVLSALVQFQGHDVMLGEIIGRDQDIQNTVPGRIIFQLLSKRLKLGDTLTGDLRYYIHRNLKMMSQETKLYLNVNTVFDVSHRIVLISAEPGMGKSTLLTHVALYTKQIHPDMWVIRVNLNDYTRLLEKLPKNLNLHHVIEFILEVSGITEEWKNLCRLKLASMENICLLFDGYDEISPTYENTVTLILRCAQAANLQTLWITTRPVMRQKLEQELSTLALTLEPFTERDQRNFLFKFWKSSIPDIEESILDKFITNLLLLTEKNFNDRDKQFTGIPLQSLLLAEVFEEHLTTYIETGELRLPQRFDLYELYNYFLERKLNIYYEKNKIDRTKAGILIDYDEVKNLFEKNHMISALLTLLPSEELKKLHISQSNNDVQIFLKKFEDGKEKTGIIQQIVDSKPVFIHRTFAEYFVALWFTRNFESTGIVGYLQEKLFDPNFQIVKNFFDRILSQKYELHVAVLNLDRISVKKLLSQQKLDVNARDEGGRTALHLAVMCCSDIQKRDDSDYYDYDDYCDEYNNVFGCPFFDLQKIISILLEYGADPSIEDKVLCWRPLRIADKLRTWAVIGLLLENQADSSDLVLTWENIHNSEVSQKLLQVATQQGLVQLVAFAIKCGINVEHKVDCKPLLHLAAEHGHLKLVQFLVEQDANIYAWDTFQRSTALMSAAAAGHLEVVRYLLEQGVGLSAKDPLGNTALLIAAKIGHIEVFKFLLEHENITTCDYSGNTVLHHAAKLREADLTEYILSIQTLDINCCNKKRRTPLWHAVKCGSLQITKVLCEHGADLNVQDETGWTPLHLEVREGDLQIVKYLVEYGASVITLDHEGYKPLDIAVQYNRSDIIEFLQHRPI